MNQQEEDVLDSDSEDSKEDDSETEDEEAVFSIENYRTHSEYMTMRAVLSLD